jgi:hypothetical protein
VFQPVASHRLPSKVAASACEKARLERWLVQPRWEQWPSKNKGLFLFFCSFFSFFFL